MNVHTGFPCAVSPSPCKVCASPALLGCRRGSAPGDIKTCPCLNVQVHIADVRKKGGFWLRRIAETRPSAREGLLLRKYSCLQNMMRLVKQPSFFCSQAEHAGRLCGWVFALPFFPKVSFLYGASGSDRDFLEGSSFSLASFSLTHKRT